jgi:hypothetical protein
MEASAEEVLCGCAAARFPLHFWTYRLKILLGELGEFAAVPRRVRPRMARGGVKHDRSVA